MKPRITSNLVRSIRTVNPPKRPKWPFRSPPPPSGARRNVSPVAISGWEYFTGTT
jgi:hypothetical protein